MNEAEMPPREEDEEDRSGPAVLKWVGIAFGVVAIVIALAIAALDTGAGRRFLVQQLDGYTLSSGLTINIGGIDGSLYGRAEITDLRLSDLEGEFLSVPRALIDWHPFELVSNHIDIDELIVPSAQLARLPVLRPSQDPDAPILPNIDIDIDALQIGRLELSPEFTGQRHALAAEGEVHLANGRAIVDLDARALSGDGIAGGDTLALKLNAIPDDNIFDVEAQLAAPAEGAFAALTGIDQPLRLSIDGDGSWDEWRGELLMDAGGSGTALAIRNNDGTLRAQGTAALAPFLPSSVLQRLAGDTTEIDLTAELGERRADIRFQLASDAIAAEGGGGVNLDEGRFGDFAFSLQLLQPQTLEDNLRGENIRGDVELSGRLSRPDIAFEARASQFGLESVRFTDVRAEGRVQFDEGGVQIPVQMAADRALGLPDLISPLARGLAIGGTFRIADGRAVAPDLAVRSANAAGRANIIVDLSNGSYNGNFTGRAPRFVWDVFGVFDARADIDFRSAPGGFALSGPIRARSLQINNAILARLAGGPATITGNLVAPGNGLYGLDNMRVQGPEIDASGYARLLPSGQLEVRLSGTSAAYGPFVANVGGTADAIRINVNAESPTFGLPFRNVTAEIVGTAEGYLITARGDTDFGEATVEALYTDDGRIVVRSAELAGVTVEGELSQTPGGVFAGTLDVSGNGLSGTIALDERGGAQFAAIDVTGRNVTFQGVGDAASIGIRRLFVDMTVQMTDGVPIVQGQANIEQLRYGTTTVQRARAVFDYENGRGAVRLVADGRAGLPFEVAVNGRFTDQAFVAAIEGEVSGQDFRTVRPLRILAEDNAYRLMPARIALDGGEILAAGTYGDGLAFNLRTEGFDLSIINAFLPSGGFSGDLTASLDWRQETMAAFPDAELRVQLDNFRRAGTVAVSQPIDGVFRGSLDATGGRLTGEIQERGRNIGRVRVGLEPLGPGEGPWRERLFEAPLSGGIRFNGPASALFSFIGLAGQQLGGQLAVAADFDGRVDAPELRGWLLTRDLTYENETLGTRITNIEARGRFTNDSFVIERFTGNAGDGTVSAEGSVSLAAENEYPMDVSLTFDNAQLADSADIAARVSGTLNFLNEVGTPPQITGELQLPEARYRISRGGEAEIVELDGVRRVSESRLVAEPLPTEDPTDPGNWQLDIDVVADNRIYVTGMGLESEWSANLEIGGTASAYRVGGEVDLVRGTFGFAGQRFELTQGRVEFLGGEEIDPVLDIRAETEVDDITAIIDITGRAFDPQIEFSSNPARPEDEILALILFGGPPSELGALEAVQLAASLNSLRGGGGGLNPLGELQRATGFDRLRVLGADEATGRGTALAVGAYLGDDVYLEVITDTQGFTATQIEIALSRAFSILSTISTQAGQSAGIRYSKDY